MTQRHAWITQGLMKSCIRKSKLYMIYCKNRTLENKLRFTNYRNKLKSLLDKAEKFHYFELFNKMSGNIKETWKLLNSALNKK